jgi:transcriptional regulator with XRE-family HTH domain
MARVDEQIRRARRESGLSQEALAERIGVRPATVERYEQGGEITSRHLELIAVATGRPVSFFLYGEDDASRNGRVIGRWLRAAAAWLSEPAPVDADADLAARERALAERERRVVERERALAAAKVELAARAGHPLPADGHEGYNLDELERTLDERGDSFPERAEEWRAYVLFLREFVHADGQLPASFNALVREVFRELLASPEGQ